MSLLGQAVPTPVSATRVKKYGDYRQAFAEQSAAASNMTYCLLKASDATAGHCEVTWHSERREANPQTIRAEQPAGLFG